MKKLVLFIAALLAVQFSFAQKADIKYNLKVGHEYTQVQEIKGINTQNVMGMDIETTVTQKASTVYKVKSFTNGIYDLEVRYKNIAAEVGSAYGNFSLDSEGAGGISSMLKSMTDTPFSIKMDSKGKVIEVTGADKVLADALAKSDISAVEKAQAEAQLGQFFSEENIKRTGVGQAVFPAGEVSPGETWTVDMNMAEQGMDMNVKIVYEYVGRQGGNWVIRGTGTIETPEGTTMEAQGMVMDVSMKGTMNINIRLDAETGWNMESAVKQTVNGNISTEIPMQGRMDISMKMTNDVTVKGIK